MFGSTYSPLVLVLSFVAGMLGWSHADLYPNAKGLRTVVFQFLPVCWGLGMLFWFMFCVLSVALPLLRAR